MEFGLEIEQLVSTATLEEQANRGGCGIVRDVRVFEMTLGLELIIVATPYLAQMAARRARRVGHHKLAQLKAQD